MYIILIYFIFEKNNEFLNMMAIILWQLGRRFAEGGWKLDLFYFNNYSYYNT